MAALEEITRGAAVKGILPDGLVTISDVRWIGTVAVEVTYKDSSGRLGNELLYRDREPTLEIAAAGRPWSFDGDGNLFRLLSEANRIRLAYLFDPLLAVHTSLVDPLPHQITAVYAEMLSRQPLRFLLADDPGARKTIMTGLLTKELRVRGDLQRCLIVCPGNLAEQWQDEMDRRFHLPFEIMTNDTLEAARTGNWFAENPMAICRLDKLSRNEDVQAKLRQTDWDLIVCDEAHKLSATYFGNEVKYTKRYRLAQLLSTLTRHFLLLTATPHNGKEADFQLFMALLDGDRFEGKFRDGVHVTDASDMMRRLVKEQLLKFDGTPLFPERRAYTVNYPLSDAEANLYKDVTDYVREEFNRAEALENEGRKGTVGFALTILQRRLASSPEAIYQSLRRRRERLEKRLREEELLKRGADVPVDLTRGLPILTVEELLDLDDAPDAEVEETEERVVDQASAASTITELKAEIGQLQDLERIALRVRRSGTDRKWDELSRLLQNNSAMFDAEGHRRKLVLFTEHRDTLNYLSEQIRALIGKPEAVVIIHGGIGREDRRKAQESFTHDLETRAMEHAAIHLVPQHLAEVRGRKEELIDKTKAAVQERLTKEINYWDHRAAQLKDQELAGKTNAKLNSGLAPQRADELTARLQKRLTELEQERKLSPLPPIVLGGALIVPLGLLRQLQGTQDAVPATFAQETERSERLAMQAVMETERRLGFVPRDVSDENCGYDVESAVPGTGLLRFNEVKGRVKGARTVTITKNEILTGLNKPDEFILGIVIIDEDVTVVRYCRTPFATQPDFNATSVNYDLDKLLAQAREPE